MATFLILWKFLQLTAVKKSKKFGLFKSLMPALLSAWIVGKSLNLVISGGPGICGRTPKIRGDR